MTRTNQLSDWREEIRRLENENRRAFLDRDIDRLRVLWSDDLIVNTPINLVHQKQQVLELLAAGTIAHVNLEGQVESIQRHGDVAIVMGSEIVTNTSGGPIIRRRFTNVWHAEAQSWRLIARHANVIADATP